MKSQVDASWIKVPDKISFYLMFELDGPWERKIELSQNFPPKLREYLQEIRDRGIKFKYICLKNTKSTIQDAVKVLFYSAHQTNYVNFEKVELSVPRHKLTTIIKSLVEHNEPGYSNYLSTDPSTRDLFVCTHGERDQCCGKFGFGVVTKLGEILSKLDKTKVWSSSHLGGHRLGPTMIDMPSGKLWGYLNEDILSDIIAQNCDPKTIIHYYRGNMGLDRYSQILEKKLFQQLGWDWFHADKKSEIIEVSELARKVSIEFRSKTKTGSYTAEIIESGRIEIPDTHCSKGTVIPKFTVSDVTLHSS